MKQPHPSRPPRLALDGVLLLDKPLGWSSTDALTRAKHLLRAKKAGHTGTLDPLATGLLPLCFGEATKFSQDLLDARKTYEARLRLGIRTATGDAEGEVLATREVTCDRAAVEAVLPRFRGAQTQVPPMYSALKRDGKPLYEYARAGLSVERAARDVTIELLELLDCALPDSPEFSVRVTCSKGTYIRTLAEDIGEALGCGAHLVALRRTAVGELTLAGALTLEALAAIDEAERPAALRPVDYLLSGLQVVSLDELLAARFRQGQRLRLEERMVPQEGVGVANAGAGGTAACRVAVYQEYSEEGREEGSGTGPVPRLAAQRRLLGTAMLDDGVLAPERLIVTQSAG